ncbi:hypothetical protein ABEB36_002129 [Hypothenemus hampei]|uniref:WD repeat-containing protein 74 n=1 Tax=Hypothenemus hampei TaxID=57062 RepID=A0ABD1F501_HYPHA
MDLSKLKFYVGTARGVLLCTTDKLHDVRIFKNCEITEVTALCQGRNADELALGYGSGNVHLFDTITESFTRKLDRLEGDESVTGVCCFKKSFIVSNRDGVVNVWTTKKNDWFSLNLEESGSLDALAHDTHRSNVIATGGEFNDYKLWNIETKQCIFKAKSLGQDHLQLAIPTSIRAISFFPNQPYLGACCTKQGHVLLYDDRAQRKPVIKFLEEKASYTTISSTFRDNQICVGTTKGYMQWLNLNKSPKILKTYTTFTGSVTDITCDPLEPFVYSVSLDRHLRIHNMDTKELLHKFYMKQNLTKLLVKSVIKNEEKEEIEKCSSTQDVDREYEELFKNMEEVNDDESRKIVKRRLRNAENMKKGFKRKKLKT